MRDEYLSVEMYHLINKCSAFKYSGVTVNNINTEETELEFRLPLKKLLEE